MRFRFRMVLSYCHSRPNRAAVGISRQTRYNWFMSYIRRVLQDRPISLWQASGVSLADNSGNAQSIVSSAGTAVAHAPLQPASTNALRISGTATFTLPSGDIFYPGFEKRPFTLEAWVLPLQNTSTHPFLSHSGLNDGLSQNAGNIQFSVPLTTGTITLSYTPPSIFQEWHVVGVFDGTKMYLYLDGELVKTYTLSVAEDAAQFSASITAKQFVVGTGNFVIDGIGIYASPLSAETVQAHYMYGQQVREVHGNVAGFGGWTYDIVDDTSNVFFAKTFEFLPDWFDAALDGVNVTEAGMTPLLDASGLTVAGTWTYAINLNGSGISTWQGAKIEWLGSGNFTVQTSVDEGATWNTESSYSLMTSLAFGASMTGIDDILVKVTFTAGQNPITTPVSITDLRLVVYKDLVQRTSFGTMAVNRVGTVMPSSLYYQPNEMDIRAGAKFTGTGTVTIAPDTDASAQPIRTIDVWFRPNTLASTQTIFTGSGVSLTMSTAGALTATGAAALYRNGALNSGFADNLVVGAWYHLVVVLSANLTTTLTLGSGTFQLGNIATYPTALTAAQVTNLFTNYISRQVSTFVDPMVTTLTEQGYTSYTHAWSISGSG